MQTQTSQNEAVHLPQTLEPRNPGMELDLDWVMRATANRSAIERRAATLPGRRSVKKDYQAAWLCRAVTCIDLTTLAGDDTVGRVARMCAKARQPVRAAFLGALGMTWPKPPIFLMFRTCDLSYTRLTSVNSRAVMMPWANIWKTAPLVAMMASLAKSGLLPGKP